VDSKDPGRPATRIERLYRSRPIFAAPISAAGSSWERDEDGVPDDGVQADGECIKGLAIVGWFAAADGGRPRDQIHRWDQGEARRLKFSINDN